MTIVLSLTSSLKMSNRVKDCLLRTGEGDLGGDRKIIIFKMSKKLMALVALVIQYNQ